MAKSFVQFGKDKRMSNIGRKPIDLGSVAVEVKGSEVHYKGKQASGVYILPLFLDAKKLDNKLKLEFKSTDQQQRLKKFWGMHRALLANLIKGAESVFEKNLEINGLGFKASLAGKKVTLALGYTHKIDLTLPDGISLEIDKTGQKLKFKGINKELLGKVCDTIRSFRAPEPYKGTGIRLENEKIIRKVGKAKGTAGAA